jgi:hypothetical protein
MNVRLTGSPVVEHSTHNPKVLGSKPTAGPGKMAKKHELPFSQMEIFESDQVSEYWYSSSAVDWASVVVRRYLGDPHFEVEWLAGPLPASGSGIEVVMTYQALIEENAQPSNADEQVAIRSSGYKHLGKGHIFVQLGFS